MLNFREHVVGRTLATILSSSLAMSGLVACGAPSGDPSSGAQATESPSSATQAYDGATVLRGVFFGRGPVAALFPETWGPTKAIGEREAAGDPRALADQVDRYASTLCAQGCSDTTRDGLRSAAARLRSGEKDRLVADPSSAMTHLQGPSADAAIDAVIARLEGTDPGFVARFGTDVQSGDPVRVDRAINDASQKIAQAAAGLAAETDGLLSLGGTATLHPYEELDGPFILVVVVAIAVVLVVSRQSTRVGDGLEHDKFIANVTAKLQHV